MRFTAFTALALILGSGLAFAAEDPSGRPGQVLNEDQCQQAWEAAAPDGGALSETKAAPYTLNFERLDTSDDGKISSEEWQAGCNKGWISVDARDVTPQKNPADADMKESDADMEDKPSVQ